MPVVFDCRGFGLSLPRCWPPYLVSLLGHGFLPNGPLGIGLVNHQPQVVALLGALRFGDEFECTAIPEIRAQVSTIIDDWAMSATV